jgi:hypothetical protein
MGIVTLEIAAVVHVESLKKVTPPPLRVTVVGADGFVGPPAFWVCTVI